MIGRNRRPQYYTLDANRQPVPCDDVLTWAKWHERHDNRRVAWTDLGPRTHISTVFLGIDHNFLGEGDPVLFETMVFIGGDGEDMVRTTTWARAQAAHNEMVEHVRARCRELERLKGKVTP